MKSHRSDAAEHEIKIQAKEKPTTLPLLSLSIHIVLDVLVLHAISIA